MHALRFVRPLALLSVAFASVGCSSWVNSAEGMLGYVSPYKIDVQQGNVVTSEQLAELKVGMSRPQVRDVMGTPLITDSFHPDRWDYLFVLNRPGRLPQRREVVLTFNGDKLQTIDAPELPSEREFVAAVARTGLPAIAMTLALTEEQLKLLPVPAKPAVSAPLPPPSTTTRLFPPLEPS